MLVPANLANSAGYVSPKTAVSKSSLVRIVVPKIGGAGGGSNPSCARSRLGDILVLKIEYYTIRYGIVKSTPNVSAFGDLEPGASEPGGTTGRVRR